MTVGLGMVCLKIGSGATPRGGSGVYCAEGTSLIRSQNVHNDGFRRDGLARIDDVHAEELRSVDVREGDVLLNITGDSVARACQAPADVLPARVNQHVMIIRPRADVLDSTFLKYFFLTPESQARLLNWASSGGTRPALTKGMIESIVVPAPPLPQQKAIAETLGALDDKIALNRRMNETLEAIAQAIFKSWFVDFEPVPAHKGDRKPPGVPDTVMSKLPDRMAAGNGIEVPSGWQALPFFEAFEVNPRRHLAAGHLATYLDMKNMPTRGHRASAWSKAIFVSGSRFCNGDTLMARITPCLENGKTAFVDFLDDGEVAFGSTEFIVLRPKPPLPVEYAYYLARSENIRSFAIQNMTGTSGRQRVPTSCFDQLVVPVPPAEIAAAFGSTIRALMRLIRANSEESCTLSAMRDALLPRLLSGELRVADMEKTTSNFA